MNKKISLHSEIAYLLALTILAFSVAMVAAADFGVSMIVAPAYIVHLKFPQLFTFGQAEYVVQAVMFVIFCILMKRIKLVYFVSFLSGVIYGFILDAWRAIIPFFVPDVVLPLYVRIPFLLIGMTITSFSVALIFRTYVYPQVYDFFVKAVSQRYNLDRGKFKSIYDASSFVLSILLSLLFFGGIRGIGIGTIIMTVCNGFIISFFGKQIDKIFEIKPYSPSIAKKFDI